ncbi:phosphomannomutase [Rhizobium sp. CG5]|uniref:phosphomannomutase n=1 Tax=Rhizobium sp. CG5 TaxID=2726076 RepID=UPI0020342577|nr:phosphomannomutase [Rhizobium sp. CG5]MCM2473577.1 phosphomannomutase [Rhizobium sp. CG5]
MAPKFGTSGLRGLSIELVGSVSALYATAFAHVLLSKGMAKPGSPVLVGRDFRPSSPEISTTAMAALRRAGLEPIDCGELPTPALALYGMKLNAGSLMITGSHIPADRNGIKFYRPDGEIDKDDETAITGKATELAGDRSANLVEVGSGPDHAERAAQLFMERNQQILPAGSLRGLKIGVYQHSSVARDMMVTLLEGYGADVMPLGRSDIFIPVDTEAVSEETLEKLAAWASEHQLDAIVSTDGDADRPLVADEHGSPLRGDLLGLIAARFLKAGVLVTPVTSNSGIEAACGGIVKRTRVGSPYVIAAMNEALVQGETGVMGFEANGGLMLGSDFTVEGRTLAALPTRDCILPLLATLYASASAKAPLSGVAAGFSLPIALSDRIENYPLDKSGALMAFLRAAPANLATFLAPIGTVKSTTDIDGLRVTLDDDSVIHFRPSGNAPEMRCYVEASSHDAADTLMGKGLALLDGWQPA